MLEGLKEVKQSLKERGIQMVILHQSPEKAAYIGQKSFSRRCRPRVPEDTKKWRNDAANQINCPLIQVESDVDRSS